MLYFEHLKDFKSNEGYWSSGDCVVIAKDILAETSATSMLEIGFNIGYSASIWIESGVTNLIVFDINRHPDTYQALRATAQRYKEQATVKWWLGDSKDRQAYELYLDPIDICFIDGEHSYYGALNDSWLGIHYGAKWLVYDDVIENHENGIDSVIKKLISEGAIEQVKSYPMTWTEQGNVVLCKVKI